MGIFAKLLGISALREEIEARKAAEAALRLCNADLEHQLAHRGAALDDQKNLFALTADAAGVGTFLWTKADNRLIRDERARALLGIGTASLVAGDGFLALFDHEGQAQSADPVTVQSQSDRSFSEYRLRNTGNGSERRVGAWTQNFYDETGALCRVSGVVLDLTERHTPAETLRDEQIRVSNIIENMSDAFYTLDKDWRFLFVNKKAAEVFEKSEEDLIGRSVWEHVPGYAKAVLKDRFVASVVSQQKACFVLHLERLESWAEINLYPHPDGLSVFFQDITGRHLSEERLTQKINEQTALTRFSVEALVSEDLAELFNRAASVAQTALKADFAAVFLTNPALSQSEVLGRVGWSTAQLAVLQAHPMQTDSMTHYLLTVEPSLRISDLSRETRFKPHPMLAQEGATSGAAVAVTGVDRCSIAVLVFTRKKREFSADDEDFLQTVANLLNAMRERHQALSQLRLRDSALDATSQGVTITDERGPEPIVIYTNPAFASLTGWAVEDIVGARSRDFMAPQTHPGLVERLALARAKRRSLNFEAVVRRKNQTTFLDSVAASPIVDRNGDLTHYIAVHEDITEARARDDRLLEAQKMESIGQLTGGVAHDFNNLLTVIKANAEDLREELREMPFLKRQIELVLQAADRGGDLVQQLMAFARKQELRPRSIDLSGMLDSFSSLLRRTLQANITVEILKAHDLPPVMVDPGRLENALLNLALNSRDAMGGGGTLTIETSLAVLDADYVADHQDAIAGTYVMIAVSDTGSGMPQDVVERAFQPFFTTKEVGKGTGLGLSMVYGFLKQTGGHAKIYSELGLGTTIRIYLPPAIPIAEVRSVPIEAPEQTRASGRILLVEDDDLVCQTISAKLERMGYSIVTADTAPKAIAVLEESADFDLVFTDVIMPGSMSGADLVREVQKRWPTIKLLMTSGYTQNTVLGKVEMPPGVRLLSKPYTSDTLARVLGEVMGTGSIAA